MDDDLIAIEGSRTIVGHSVVDFASATTGLLVLPDPELPFLKTTFAGDCNTAWELRGYTNLEVRVAKIQSSCKIFAPGGTGASELLIDFNPELPAKCTDGNYVVVSKDDDEDTVITIKKAGTVADATITVGKNFQDINLLMTDCQGTHSFQACLPNLTTCSSISYNCCSLPRSLPLDSRRGRDRENR